MPRGSDPGGRRRYRGFLRASRLVEDFVRGGRLDGDERAAVARLRGPAGDFAADALGVGVEVSSVLASSEADSDFLPARRLGSRDRHAGSISTRISRTRRE